MRRHLGVPAALDELRIVFELTDAPVALVRCLVRDTLHARRQALSTLAQDKFAVHKLFVEVAPRYAERPGGYTRILKLGPRRSDATEMVYLELV